MLPVHDPPPPQLNWLTAILNCFKVSLTKGTLLLLLNDTCCLLYNFFIWVLWQQKWHSKYNCHISIRTTICLPRLHTVDCSILVTKGFMVYTMQLLFCGFTLRVWWLGCMGVGLYWISDQQNLDRSIENDTGTCRTSPEIWKTVNCSTNCKRMKDDN